jgi:urea carboxylase system permease
MGEPTARTDDQDLARAGYRPQFARGLGSFTAFAAGFSYLSILTGIPQNFYLGYREAGPAFVWTWPVVFLGQFCLAVCFADLARAYPFCGGVYAWSRRTGSAIVGWLTGWVYVASLIFTLAAVALAWQIVLPAIWPGFQFMGDGQTTQNAAVLGAILIVLSTVVNIAGTRWMAVIMNAGVLIELAGAIVLIGLLAVHAVRGPGVVFDVRPGVITDGFGVVGPFLAAAVVSAYIMYGFDTAGTLAEETVDPRRRGPRAILQALVAAVVLGGLLLLVALMAAPDLNDPLLGSDQGGLPYLIKQVLGDALGKVILVASVVAIFVCTLAVQANTARVVFAMARDGAIPGARWLGRVHEHRKTPHMAVLLIGGLACALLLFNIKSPNLMIALVCVSIVWANLAYLLTTASLLVARVRGASDVPVGSKWRLIANVVAVAWGVLLIVNIGWPRERFYGTDWSERYAAPLYTGVLILVGLGIYLRANWRNSGGVS